MSTAWRAAGHIRLAALLRQPMAQFLLGGALIFALSGVAGNRTEREAPAAERQLRIVQAAASPDAAVEAGDRFLLGDDFRDVPAP